MRQVLLVRNELLRQRARWRPTVPPRGTSWLFVATLPNSGSTALARLLCSSPEVFMLEGRGEGQWLVPQMSAPGSRWDPALPLDHHLVRAVWFDRARRRSGGRTVVLEKSPSSIVRMRALLAAFADTRPRLVVFTRDPFAVCASWATRKTPQTLVQAWLPAGTPPPPDEPAFFALVARLCGERMSYLADLTERPGGDTPPLLTSYEELTGSPAHFVRRLCDFVPELGEVDPDASIRGVKGYPDQPLRNMNAEQIDRLSPQQRSWLRTGLEPYAETIGALGYRI